MRWADVPWGDLLAVGGLVWVLTALAMEARFRVKFAPYERLFDKDGRPRFVEREAIMDADGRPKFCSREDVNGLSQKLDERIERKRLMIERNAGLFVALDDRVGDLEEKAARIEERQTMQWERISDQMAQTARTIEDVARRLERISEMQQEHALRLERIHRGDAPQ